MPIDSLITANLTGTNGDKRAAMASAPLVYNADHSVAWEQMWDSFCVLASAGGPPHRATLLCAQTTADPASEGYHLATAELIRGIALVSGLTATPAQTGWLAVECGKASKARWLSEQIGQENVESYAEGTRFFVPVGDNFTLTREIKNIVTAVAKTTHYWREHLAPEIKTSLEWEARFKTLVRRVLPARLQQALRSWLKSVV